MAPYRLIDLPAEATAAEKILVALAQYRFLTVPQMQRFGIAGYYHATDTLRELAGNPPKKGKKRGLRFPKLVNKLAKVDAETGQRPSIFHLTERGAKYLAEATGGPLPDYPKNPSFSSQFEHRIGMVNAQILFEEWAQAEGVGLVDMVRDFDGPQATAVETMHGRIVPDLRFAYVPADGIKRECCVEFYRGDDAHNHAPKIAAYAAPLCDKSLNNAIGTNKGMRVFVLSETDALQRSLFNRLSKIWPHEYASAKPHFQFGVIGGPALDPEFSLVGFRWRTLP